MLRRQVEDPMSNFEPSESHLERFRLVDRFVIPHTPHGRGLLSANLFSELRKEPANTVATKTWSRPRVGDES